MTVRRKRSAKFWRKNEQKIMKKFGLVPTKNSGSGWIEKEDGQNEYTIAQLKSTDTNSIRVNLADLLVLESNAATSRKIPVFVLQYLETDDIFFVVRPYDMKALDEYLKTGRCERPEAFEVALDEKRANMPNSRKVVTSGNRDAFWAEKRKEWSKCQKQ